MKGFVKTIRTTSNFWVIFSMKKSNKDAKIFFRDGSSLRLNCSQYWKVRDVLLAGYKVDQLDNDLFRIRDSKITLIGSSDMLRSVIEQVGFYSLDIYQDKIVLDIGGFQGESAVLFWKMGAKMVVIYEPVPEHQEIIKQNMSLNNVKSEMHEAGVGSLDSIKTISYETTDLGFGNHGNGPNELQIRIQNIASVINESHANVAKFNCEGAEESLVDVPSEVLRKIDFYIIMAHTPEISKAIINKLTFSGFSLFKANKKRSFLCFKKLP